MDDVRYWIGFNLVTGIGPIRFRRLLSYFKSAEAAWRAEPLDLERSGLEPRLVEVVLRRRREIDLEREMARVERAGARVLHWEHGSYPSLLKQIDDAPPVLYVLGDLRASDELAVAIVGTRRASTYGKQVCESLVEEIAGRGVTIVSGLAKGIDASAHRAAIRAGGRTVAVVGAGVDVVYPPEHAGLAREIVRCGAIVSELPMGTTPDAGNFPARNRIISGMSRATLVVEAGEKSGALITSSFAVDQGRDVLAIPGSIYWPGSIGTNRLIQQGAKLVQTAADVLDEMKVTETGRQLEMRELLPEDPTEQALMALLTAQPVHIDDIVRQSQLPASAVSSGLAMLELKGLARQVGGMQYVAMRRWTNG